jgi:hypothetical protein
MTRTRRHPAIFEVNAHHAMLRQTPDILDNAFCGVAVSGFHINAERQRRHRANARHHVQQLVEGHRFSVVVAQHGGDRRAGGAQRRVTELLSGERAAGVPDVGDKQGRVLMMQCREVHGSLRLCVVG